MTAFSDYEEACSIAHLRPRPRSGDAPDVASAPEPRLQRRLVEQADAQFGTAGDLTRVWSEIRNGASIVSDAFCSSSRHFVVLTAPTQRKRISVSDCQLLERVLLSGSQKRIAMDRGMSESTLSMQSRRALTAIGARVPASKAPLVFALLVSASDGERGAPHDARVCQISDRGTDYYVVSMPRPELGLECLLTLAEYEVLCRLVEGWSYARIAFARKTAVRTVANQVASVFRRLEISGRNELISLLVAGLCKKPAEAGADPCARAPQSDQRSARMRAPEPVARS